MTGRIERVFQALQFIPDLHIVGGAVRDALLGIESDDVDAATSAEPQFVKMLCKSEGLRVVDTGIDHGTVTVFLDEEPVEITTFRFDVSTDGRNATVQFADSIVDDLARRDITFNAMAWDGENVIDPFNGQDDLERGVVDTVGSATRRFSEDFLRILRAARFAARFGFEIDEIVLDEMAEKQGLITENVSVERIKTEFDKAFKDSAPSRFVNVLSQIGFIRGFLPELEFFNTSLLDFASVENRWSKFLCFQTEEEINSIADRLRFSNDLRRECIDVKNGFDFILEHEFTEANIRRFQFEFGNVLDSIADVFTASARSHGTWNQSDWFDERQFIEPIVTGQVLIERGVEQGPEIGELIREAHSIQLDEGITDQDILINRVLS